MTLPTNDLERLTKGQLVSDDGSKIGRIADIYLDKATNQPEWVLVNTGLFGSRESFVPLAQASEQDGDIAVPYDKSFVKGAPNVDADGELSEAEEAELYSYYGLADPFASRAGSPPASAKDEAMTRSEEELRVGTVKRPSELVRLKKVVVTEHKQMTVPVEHEEVRVVREPITDANRDQAMSGAEIGGAEHEMTLNEEEIVVEKRVVPKERVRLDKEAVTEDKTVAADVRKEKIDVEREKQ